MFLLPHHTSFPQDYLSAVLEYLEKSPTRTPADEIQGIWVASETYTVVGEVAAVANAYFPNVLIDNIVYVSGGMPNEGEILHVPTRSTTQVQRCGVRLRLTCDFYLCCSLITLTITRLRLSLGLFSVHVRV